MGGEGRDRRETGSKVIGSTTLATGACNIKYSEPVVSPCGLPDRQTGSWCADHTQTSNSSNFPRFVCRIWFDREDTPVCTVHGKISVFVCPCRSDRLTKGGECRTRRCGTCRRQLMLAAMSLHNKVSLNADCGGPFTLP